MDEGGSSQATQTDKTKGIRRIWTTNEEEALLTIVDKIVAGGGRADNGTFKSGTFSRIEKALTEMLPDCGLMAFPHIDSKIRKWKKQYWVIFHMLNTSGFGWNDAKKCVEVDSDEVWQSYIQSHREAKKWRNKPWPLYERLANIFGKDRVTGDGAKTLADMVNEFNEKEINIDDDNEDEDEDDCSPMSVTQPASSQHTTRADSNISSRKRSRSEDNMSVSIEKVAKVFLHVYNQTVKSMNMIAERMLDDKEDRSDIADELATMGLTVDDELEALTLILQKSYNISAFKSLRGERKLAFVRKLLRENKI